MSTRIADTVSPARWDVRRAYVDGALLASEDLQAAVERAARLRGLHVTNVHATWGVALGFGVATSMKRDSVIVGEGLAYDARGREIYSSRDVRIPLPTLPAAMTTARWLDLLIRARDTGPRDRELACSFPCNDAELPRERAVFRWSLAGDALFGVTGEFGADVRLGIDVPLARFRMDPVSGAPSDPVLVARRVARKLVRPYVASGIVRVGEIAVDGSVWHWIARVDTAAAGFSTPSPRYFPTLGAHPLVDGAWSSLTLNDPSRPQRMFGPLVSILESRRTSFVIDVRFATTTDAEFRGAPGGWLAARPQRKLPVPITWIGMEDVEGCPPPSANEGTAVTLLDLEG